MRCPFSGKPCLLPKEISVTEVKDDKTHYLFLCKLCEKHYLENTAEADVVTKSLEVISSRDGVTYTRENILEDLNKQPEPQKIPANILKIKQIRRLKEKMEEAIAREDYESAGQLKEIIADMEENLRIEMGKSNHNNDEEEQ